MIIRHCERSGYYPEADGPLDARNNINALSSQRRRKHRTLQKTSSRNTQFGFQGSKEEGSSYWRVPFHIGKESRLRWSWNPSFIGETNTARIVSENSSRAKRSSTRWRQSGKSHCILMQSYRSFQSAVYSICVQGASSASSGKKFSLVEDCKPLRGFRSRREYRQKLWKG